MHEDLGPGAGEAGAATPSGSAGPTDSGSAVEGARPGLTDASRTADVPVPPRGLVYTAARPHGDPRSRRLLSGNGRESSGGAGDVRGPSHTYMSHRVSLFSRAAPRPTPDSMRTET